MMLNDACRIKEMWAKLSRAVSDVKGDAALRFLALLERSGIFMHRRMHSLDSDKDRYEVLTSIWTTLKRRPHDERPRNKSCPIVRSDDVKQNTEKKMNEGQSDRRAARNARPSGDARVGLETFAACVAPVVLGAVHDYAFIEIRRRVAQHMAPHAAAGHGFDHCEAVLAHVDAALAVCEPRLSDEQSLVLRLAALLHDADDPKLFAAPPSTDRRGADQAYPNARSLLGAYKARVVDQVVDVISLVSCSANGNRDVATSDESWKLLVRAADRLEALGQVGIDRCLAYAAHKKLPLALEETQLAHTDADIDAIATPRRFADYSTGRVSSASVVDHFWDKLLHIGDMKATVDNHYLVKEAAKRTACMRTTSPPSWTARAWRSAPAIIAPSR